MSELTRDDVREIVKEETSHLSTKKELAQLERRIEEETSKLATKTQVNEILQKVDGFLKGIETEEQERVIGDAQLERRIETIEQKTGVR